MHQYERQRNHQCKHHLCATRTIRGAFTHYLSALMLLLWRFFFRFHFFVFVSCKWQSEIILYSSLTLCHYSTLTAFNAANVINFIMMPHTNCTLKLLKSCWWFRRRGCAHVLACQMCFAFPLACRFVRLSACMVGELWVIRENAFIVDTKCEKTVVEKIVGIKKL